MTPGLQESSAKHCDKDFSLCACGLWWRASTKEEARWLGVISTTTVTGSRVTTDTTKDRATGFNNEEEECDIDSDGEARG